MSSTEIDATLDVAVDADVEVDAPVEAEVETEAAESYLMDTPGLSADVIEGYISYGQVQGQIAWLLFALGNIGIIQLRQFFGGAIVVTVLNAISDDFNIPQLYFQYWYLFTGVPVYHTRKYMAEGEMFSVKPKGWYRPLVSTTGALGLNWFAAFMPDYQLYTALDYWNQIVTDVGSVWTDAPATGSLSYFYTNAYLFGLFFIVKTLALSYGVYNWIGNFKHFQTVSEYAAFCSPADGCNPPQEWIDANAAVEVEGEESGDDEGEESGDDEGEESGDDGEETGDEVDTTEPAEEEEEEEVCYDFFGNVTACPDDEGSSTSGGFSFGL